MFIILTHDNQSTLSSFSLFLSFVINRPVAEKALSGSIDLGLIVIKAWNSFSRLFDLFFVGSKRLISFCTICDRISSCAAIVVVFILVSYMAWILCFDFKWFQCLNRFLLHNGAQIARWCCLSLVVKEMDLSF